MITAGAGSACWRTACRVGILAAALFIAACASEPIVGPKTVTAWRIPNFESVQECVHLNVGDRLDYDFTSTERVDFSIRYYEGNATVAPIVREQVTSESGRFVPITAQDYCMVWETGLNGALINYRIVPRRSGSATGSLTPGNTGATWTVASPGTYVVGIKYDRKSIAGIAAPSPHIINLWSHFMLDLYTAQTSNGRRVAIMLEECGVPYRTHKLDLTKGEQQQADYLALNPAGQIPAIVDTDGPDGKPITVTQSGAIMLYLAEKARQFLPQHPQQRVETFEWLMFALTDAGASSTAMFFQSVLLPDKSAANEAWHEERVRRFFRVANERLAGRAWLADEVSVADFALYPVYVARKAMVATAGPMDNLDRWADALAARPGVAKGMQASS